MSSSDDAGNLQPVGLPVPAIRSEHNSANQLTALTLALQELGLTSYEQKLSELGVAKLAEVNELEVSDLEEIGLTRLQVRRLQAAARNDGTPFAPSTRASRALHPSPSQDALSHPLAARQASLARSGSPERGARRRSLSRVSFRSASTDGIEFEQQCRNAILSWLKEYGEEVSPKALGIQQHDCDLVMKLSCDVPFLQLLPDEFKVVSANSFPGVLASSALLSRRVCRSQSLLLFEMKTRAQRVEHAVKQLMTRRSLLEQRAAVNGVYLIAVTGLAEDEAAYDILQQAARNNQDVVVASVTPTELSSWQTGFDEDGDSEAALAQAVRKVLEDGPKELVQLASGLGFARRYNNLFHGGKRVNDGSWSKWLRGLPGVCIEEKKGGGYQPTSKVSLVCNSDPKPASVLMAEKRPKTAVADQTLTPTITYTAETLGPPSSRGRSRDHADTGTRQEVRHTNSRRAASPRCRDTLMNAPSETNMSKLNEKPAAQSEVEANDTSGKPCTTEDKRSSQHLISTGNGTKMHNKQPKHFAKKVSSEDRVVLDDTTIHVGTISMYDNKHLISTGNGTNMLNRQQKHFAKKVLSEDRVVLDDTAIHFGTISMFDKKKGFGYLDATDFEALPEDVRCTFEGSKKRGLYFRVSDLKEGLKPAKGGRVSFKVYIDNHSAGAYDVTSMDGLRWCKKTSEIERASLTKPST